MPMPRLVDHGKWRPELIVGLPLFATRPVRIDFVKSELVIGDAARDHARATSVPFRLQSAGIPVVEATIGERRVPLLLDTGAGNGFTLNDEWAHEHGMPGTRMKLVTHAMEASAASPGVEVFRLEHAALGPIAVERSLVGVAPISVPGVVGIAGMMVLSRCPAIVIDVPDRKLWLEGPCDRPIPERRGWFRYGRADTAQGPSADTWVVTDVSPGGPADRAGMRVGDGLVQIGGIAMKGDDLDVEEVDAVLAQPEGTTVHVLAHRDGASKILDVILGSVH
jgi:hypothetical protein